MYEEYLKAKQFLSTITNSRNEKIAYIDIQYHKDQMYFSGKWQSEEFMDILRENEIITCNRKNGIHYFLEALKEIEYLKKDFHKIRVNFSFINPLEELCIQDYKDYKNFEEGVCFSKKNSYKLNTFCPKNEHGILNLSQSYHDHLLGNSIIASQENFKFNHYRKMFFKMDHLDKNYVHLFEEDPYSYHKPVISYLARFKIK